jgi:4'-phosphopantetheinyl transferase EntD
MDILFRKDLAHGRCVGVGIPESAAEAMAQLAPEERAAVERLGEARRSSWVAGRAALRAALADLGIGAGPLISTPRGAPLVPRDALGSISHKQTLAVALATRLQPDTAIGIDLEIDAPLRVDISRRVLTPRELRSIERLDDVHRNREVLLRLSAKEAIYKALDPFVTRYVSFQEVEAHPHPDGTITAELTLTGGEGPFTVEVRWEDITPSFLLTTALIRRA